MSFIQGFLYFKGLASLYLAMPKLFPVFCTVAAVMQLCNQYSLCLKHLVI